MTQEPSHQQLIVSRDVHEFFAGALDCAMSHQGVEAQRETIGYIVRLLADFSRTDHLYEYCEQGARSPALVSLYGQACHAETAAERCAFMQRLGDVALFLAGVFAESFNRKLVDLDYYIAMGEGAYQFLAEQPRAVRPGAARRAVFGELSGNFVRFVDVLNEICERSCGTSNIDLLRLYETWLRTSSPRAAGKLRALGINVSEASISRAMH